MVPQTKMTETRRCKICQKPCSLNTGRTACKDCAELFHLKCVRLTSEDITYLESEGKPWRCDQCSLERKRSMAILDKPSEQDKLLTSIKQDVSYFRQEMKNELEKISQSMRNYTNKVDEFASKVEGLTETMSDIKQNVNSLKHDKLQLVQIMNNLKNRLNVLEQASRDCDIEVQGIPEVKNEDLNQVIKNLGIAVDYPLTDSMVSSYYRERSKRASRRGIICIRFVRYWEKEQFLKKFRERGSITPKDLGLMDVGEQKIFITCSLTAANRKLLQNCRELKRAMGYKYLWVSNGRILLKKSEREPIIQIRNEADLSNI